VHVFFFFYRQCGPVKYRSLGLQDSCKDQVESLYIEIANDRSITKSNPMVQFVKKCIKSHVEKETGNCEAAITKAYGVCSNLMNPVMSEVADVKTLIDDKYLPN
jgi:hypothetical protein